MKSQTILKLKPIFKDKIWGGSKLSHLYHQPQLGDKVGECWLISAHSEGDCLIEGGPFDGISLNELFKSHKELFANDERNEFPLLIKFIDASSDLSVQVHPNDDYERKHGRAYGKEETWLILEPSMDHTVQLGHTAKTKEELKSLIEANKWSQLLKYQPIDRNYLIPVIPGTLHAIKGGTFLLEIQQSSDTTFRVYDYNRLDEKGNARPLHLKEAIEVTSIPDKSLTPKKITFSRNDRQVIWTGNYFAIEEWNVESSFAPILEKNQYYAAIIIEGKGKIGKLAVATGDAIIITSGTTNMAIEGNMRIIVSYPFLGKAI